MSSQHARTWQKEDHLDQEIQHQPKIIKKKVKVQKRWITRGEKMMYIIFAVVFLCISAYIVSFSSSVDQLNRNIESLNAQIEQQSVHNKNLALKKKELSQPERIIKIAKDNGLKIKNTQVKQASELTE
ncbi:cell division protein FtsL [Gracilibacillus boraciitolerans JCM 21714]|uniref:Cell division protein FtsL n=1 Tax=Gracilibacillus boraciitolerans JCM 21714 TaxID=1298598 RepID=W4VEA9_9BACI|nr:cell division protein FtsL [Gracilibacillus boraciitolerans]GAE91745.1 cell division protein FtsL [Gracilibacillus boraciitolerans JCM 21714]